MQTIYSPVKHTASLEATQLYRGCLYVHYWESTTDQRMMITSHTWDAHLWGTGTAVSLEHGDTVHDSAGRWHLTHAPMSDEDAQSNRPWLLLLFCPCHYGTQNVSYSVWTMAHPTARQTTSTPYLVVIAELKSGWREWGWGLWGRDRETQCTLHTCTLCITTSTYVHTYTYM